MFSALWSWYCPSKSFFCEQGSVTCYVPTNSGCHGSHESSNFSWCSGIRKHVRISASILKSLCMWWNHFVCDINTSLKNQEHKQTAWNPQKNPSTWKRMKISSSLPSKDAPLTSQGVTHELNTWGWQYCRHNCKTGAEAMNYSLLANYDSLGRPN